MVTFLEGNSTILIFCRWDKQDLYGYKKIYILLYSFTDFLFHYLCSAGAAYKTLILFLFIFHLPKNIFVIRLLKKWTHFCPQLLLIWSIYCWHNAVLFLRISKQNAKWRYVCWMNICQPFIEILLRICTTLFIY